MEHAGNDDKVLYLIIVNIKRHLKRIFVIVVSIITYQPSCFTKAVLALVHLYKSELLFQQTEWAELKEIHSYAKTTRIEKQML